MKETVSCMLSLGLRYTVPGCIHFYNSDCLVLPALMVLSKLCHTLSSLQNRAIFLYLRRTEVMPVRTAGYTLRYSSQVSPSAFFWTEEKSQLRTLGLKRQRKMN